MKPLSLSTGGLLFRENLFVTSSARNELFISPSRVQSRFRMCPFSQTLSRIMPLIKPILPNQILDGERKFRRTIKADQQQLAAAP